MIVKHSKNFFHNYPSYALLVALISLTIIGAILLALPISHKVSMSAIDFFFTSASLTTVTGLLTVPLENFTPFGKVIILLLMQIGGIGLMTISLFFIYIFLRFRFSTQILATELLSISSFKDTKQILFFMIKLTIIAELFGAVVIFFAIKSNFDFWPAIFVSLFHSVSAFANAGFLLFADGAVDSHNYLLIFITTLLIIVGGLGFITWHEILGKFSSSHRFHKNISWHTKMVIRIYFLTTLASFILIWITERNNTLAQMSIFQALYTALFMAVSAKSAGFLPFALSSMNLTTILLFMVTMFIGSAPASTGSGIKTGVFSICLAVIRAAVLGRSQAEINGRRMIPEQIYKAIAIVMLSIFWILFITFCLLITESNWTFIDVFLESISAFTNNGISSGKTVTLSYAGKILISMSMIIGRIGALAITLGITKTTAHAILYPEEKVLLG
jgi:trk system potassium uptake protein TrkH